MNDRDGFLTEAIGGKLIDCCVVDLDNEFDIDETCVRQDTNDYPLDDCTYGKDGDKPEDCKYWQKRIKGGGKEFSLWHYFGELWEWAKGQEWWEDFIIKKTHANAIFLERIINPDNFADAIYEFLQEHND